MEPTQVLGAGPHVRLSVRLAHNWLMFDDVPTDQTNVNGDFNFAVNPRLFADIVFAKAVQETGRFLARLRWHSLVMCTWSIKTK